MKLRRGDYSPFITRMVVRPLIDRGYLTWRDAGWTADPDQGGRYLLGNDQYRFASSRSEGPSKYTRASGASEITGRVHEALVRFQQDSGIFHVNENGQRNAEGNLIHPSDQRVSSGVVGRRTLAALGQDLTSPETQRFIARNMREQAAEANITSKKDGQKIADSIVAIRNSYPNLDARVTAALALSGHGLDDPITKTMIALQSKRQAQPGWMQGDGGDAWSNIPHKRGERVPLVDELGNMIVDPSGKTTPYTKDQPKEQGGGGVGGGGPFGLATALPGVGLDRIGEAFGVKQLGDAIRTPVEWTQESVMKPAARAGFTALETPYQGVVGAARSAGRALTGGVEAAANTRGGGVEGFQRQLGDQAAQTPGIAGKDFMSQVALQTSGGIALDRLARGKDVDLGSGFFPGGRVEKTQAANSRAVLSVDGHAWTPGRYLASQIFDPDTAAYKVASGLVDMASITYLDPVNPVLKASSEARAASKVVQLADDGTPMIPSRLGEIVGMVPGIRPGVRAQALDVAMQSGPLAPVVRRLAIPKGGRGALSYNEIRRMMHGDAETAALLERAGSAGEVREILDPRLGITNGTLGRGLGTTVREVPKAPYRWQRVLRDQEQRFRAFGMTHNRSMDLSNVDDAAEQVDRVMRTTKLTPEQRNDLGSAFVLANGREEKYQALMNISGSIIDRMIADGADPKIAREVGSFWKKWDEDRAFLIDLMTGEHINPFVRINNVDYKQRHPGLEIDFLNNYVPLPDGRELRRMTSTWSQRMRDIAGKFPENSPIAKRALEHPEKAGFTTAAFDAGMRYWRGSVLARPAILGRVGIDEQLRMAATGQWDHPIHMLTSLIQHPKNQIDSLGRNVWDEAEVAWRKGDWTAYARARSRGWADWDMTSDERLMKQRGYKIYSADDRDTRSFVTAWQNHFEKLHASEVAKHLAKYGPEDTKAWLSEGGQGHGIWQDVSKQTIDRGGDVQEMPTIGAWVDNLNQHITDLVDNDPALREVIAEGKFNGVPISRITGKGSLEHSKDFRKELERRFEDGDSPAFVPGPRYSRVEQEKLQGIYDHVMNTAFDWFMTRPTNRFARSPVFFNSYWKRMEELAPALGPTERAVIAENARKMGYKGAASRAERATTGLPGHQIGEDWKQGAAPFLTHVEADQIAKSFALDEVKKLLYDVGERTVIFDTMRNLIPFGEAWKEVLTRWSRILYERPQNLRHLQVGLTGAKDAGFITTDPTTKDQVFVWPGSEWATEHLPPAAIGGIMGGPFGAAEGAGASLAAGESVAEPFGVPIPIAGSVSGLNMMAQGMPGVGPALQIPVGALLPDEKDWDWLRELVDPYGSQDQEPGESKLSTAAWSMVPPWVKRFAQTTVPGLPQTGPEQERMRATSSMATYLHTRHPNWSKQKVLDEAASKSRTFWLIRMLGSAVLPVAPLAQFQIETKQGRRGINEMKTIYYDGAQKARERGEGADYDKRFLAKYGFDTYGALAPMTDTAGIPLPRTEKQYDWVRDNDSVVKKYPYVYGWFAPHDPNGTYDPRTEGRQLRAHERFTLTPEQQYRAQQDREGWALYNDSIQNVNPDDYEQKRRIAEIIKEELPGWRDRTGMPETVNREDQLAQLRKAIRDPKLRGKEFAKGMKLYLTERDKIQAKYERTGKSPTYFIESKRAARDRAHLRNVAEIIREEVPETSDAFDSLFRSELEGVDN